MVRVLVALARYQCSASLPFVVVVSRQLLDHQWTITVMGRRVKFLSACFYGAGEWTRTTDLLITNQLLYRLSYTGTGGPTV